MPMLSLVLLLLFLLMRDSGSVAGSVVMSTAAAVAVASVRGIARVH